MLIVSALSLFVLVQDPAAKPDQTPLAQVIAASDEARSAKLAAFIVHQLNSQAVYAEQYAGLVPVKDKVTPLLTQWMTKPPKRLGGITPGNFRVASMRAVRDIVGDKASSEVIAKLKAIAGDLFEPTAVRDQAGYALAQFGDRTHTDTMLEKAGKRTSSKDISTKIAALQKIANIFYNLNEYEKAAAAHQRVIKTIEPYAAQGQGGNILASTAYNCACSLALAGKTDAAFTMLERALVESKKHKSPFVRSMFDTDMDTRSLRDDPRFKKMIDAYFAPAEKKPKTGGDAGKPGTATGKPGENKKKSP